MRSVDEHLARVTASAVVPRPVKIAISEAQGLMCAEEVLTERPLPGFDQAAVDGYAVRAVDVALAGVVAPGADEEFDAGEAELDALVEGDPIAVYLPVVGDVEPGSRTPIRLQPRQAVRVETGAPMPTLADSVVPLRWTDGGEKKVRVAHGVDSGSYVRRTGDDVQPGDVAVRASEIIGPAQVGLLAAVGRSRVLVHPRPRLSVIAVGSELVDIDRVPGAGQVYDVNSYALAAAARDAGADVNRVGIAERAVRIGERDPQSLAAVRQLGSADHSTTPLACAQRCGPLEDVVLGQRKLTMQEPHVETRIVRDDGTATEHFDQVVGDIGEVGGVDDIAAVNSVNVGGAHITMRVDQCGPFVLDQAVVIGEDDTDLHHAISALRNQTCCLEIDYSERHQSSPRKARDWREAKSWSSSCSWANASDALLLIALSASAYAT